MEKNLKGCWFSLFLFLCLNNVYVFWLLLVTWCILLLIRWFILTCNLHTRFLKLIITIILNKKLQACVYYESHTHVKCPSFGLYFKLYRELIKTFTHFNSQLKNWERFLHSKPLKYCVRDEVRTQTPHTDQ